MALKVIQECRRRNVDCVVAPYEADAQMAYLNKVGIADYIITEDSDLVLFGTQKTIFKLDLSAQGLLVDSSKLHLAMGCPENKYTFDKFRIMCILSGCDYLDSLPGIGLAKACKFVLLTAETDLTKALLKLPSYLNLKNVFVTKEYIDNFLKAEATFKHMFVFDTFKRSVVRLNDLPMDVTNIEELCSNAGLDNFHPDSFKLMPPNKFQNFKVAKHSSIWLGNFKKHEINKRSENACAFQFNVVKKSKDGSKEITEYEEEYEEKDDDSNIMAMYVNNEECEYSESEEDESIKQDIVDVKRNPFGKKICSRSPLTKTSSSLIKALCPKMPIKEVRSRFFLPFIKKSNKDVEKISPSCDFRVNKDDKSDQFSESNEQSNSFKRKGSNQIESSPKRSLIEEEDGSEKSDPEDYLKTEINNNKNSEIEEESSKLVSCDSGSTNTSYVEEDDDDDVVIISEIKGEPKKKPLNFLINSKQTISKPKIRSVGLSKPKPKKEKVKEKPKNQSSLSMFGFEKRQQV
ncbi:EXO1 family protein [Megaselia abdita]